MTPARVGLALLLLAVAAPARAAEVAVEAHAIPLDPAHPDATKVGRLDYVGGLTLLSDDPRFGGWSSMVLSPDGRHIVLISDMGWWLTAEIARDGDRLTGLSHVEIGALPATDGRPLGGDKLGGDAESMALLPDGSILVGFEQQHRIQHYPAKADGSLPLRGLPDLLPIPPDLAKAPANGGLEALDAWPEGGYIGFSEELMDGEGHHRGWLFGAGDKAIRPLSLAAVSDFRPTDLRMLPGGDALLLERRYDMIRGPGARLSILRAGEIAAGTIAGDELARLPAEMNTDNYEALGVWRDGSGHTRALILSDDNFNPLQRTLMLEFILP